MIKIYQVAGNQLRQTEHLSDIDPAQDVVWIDLLSPTVEEDKVVENFLKISIPTKEDMQEIELSNRLYTENSVNYMTMMAVSLVKLEEPNRCPITFILHNRVLVTVRYEEFLSLTYYLQSAKRPGGVVHPYAESIMLAIVESFINRIADALEIVGGDIDKISHEIFRAKNVSPDQKNKLMQVAIRRIGGKGDLLSMLRESLASISRLMIHHAGTLPDSANKGVRGKISSMNRDIAALSDHAGFLNGKMGFLLDATLGLINLEQNQIIKIFSIASVVFLPPTLVASIYGMNFQHMPELDEVIGYPLALLAMVISAVLPILYFKRRGWL